MMNVHSEETQLFKNTDECNGGNILECNSFKRIKIILNKYNQTNKTAKDAHDLINNELGDAKYSNSKLLDDFYHLINDKHNENALRDENNNEYDKIYEALTNGNECNLAQCDIIKVHYDYKRQLQGNVTSNIQNENAIKTISRIHTYFLHGYDVNRLRPKEREQIQPQQTDSSDLSDDDMDNKKMGIIYKMMQQKQQKLDETVGASKGYNKFVDQPLDDDAVDIDTDDGKDDGDDYDNYVDVDGDDINQYDEYYDTDYSNNELPDNRLFDILSDEEPYTSLPSTDATLIETEQPTELLQEKRNKICDVVEEIDKIVSDERFKDLLEKYQHRSKKFGGFAFDENTTINHESYLELKQKYKDDMEEDELSYIEQVGKLYKQYYVDLREELEEYGEQESTNHASMVTGALVLVVVGAIMLYGLWRYSKSRKSNNQR